VGFYDGAGALRDMVQNHMLQLLALVAMEPPAVRSGRHSRRKDQGAAQLRSVAAGDIVTGQYRAGAIAGAACPAISTNWASLRPPKPSSRSRRIIDNWRWKGVPFYLRTGKRLPKRTTEIVVQFRPVPHSMFAQRGAWPSPTG
jgi:glucose-6-phosphate 1-dehydrogenase